MLLSMSNTPKENSGPVINLKPFIFFAEIIENLENANDLILSLEVSGFAPLRVTPLELAP